MLYHLALYFTPEFSFLNVVHYVSFRALAALLSSLFFSFIFGSRFIEISQLFFRSQVRDFLQATHSAKEGMPTMGGIFILCVVIVNTLLWCNLTSKQVWVFLICIISFGFIGFIDDWQKIKKQRGILAWQKFIAQVIVATITVILLVMGGLPTTITFPFFKTLHPDIGLLFIPWAIFILVGCSNAVNIMDGLDGLAITSLIPNFATFSIICYVAGNCKIAQYLHIPFAGSAEIAIIGATLIGASLGFLWYNAYPAQIFMGDIGSLSLGSALALMALLSKEELLLALSGGLFVVEVISDIVQIGSYKLRGKKIFKMAPLHHHFELLGWQESKITIRFGIISFVLCLLTLMTLKMR